MRSALQICALLLLSLLLHGIWAWMPLAELPPAESSSVPPLRALDGSMEETWSPVLFSLPSRIGFSSVLPREQLEILPPLQSPVKLPVQIQGELPLQAPILLSQELPANGLGELADRQLISAFPQAEPRLRKWTLTQLEGESLQLQLYRMPPPQMASQLSRIEATLHLNRYGQVESCILLQPEQLGDELRSVMLALRRVRSRPGQAGRVLRVALEREQSP